MVNTTNTDVASQISNKKYTVLTSTWYNGGWINMADTNQRNNMQEVLNGVGQQVKQAQAEIKTATNQASSAMSSASAAIESSKVNSQAIVDVNSATSEAKADAATAFNQAKSAMSAATSNSSAISTLDSSVSSSLSSANDRITSAKSAIDANSKAISANEAANSSAVASLTKTVTNNATSANSAIADAKAEIATNTKSITAVKSVADSAQSASINATKTASDASVTAVDAKSDAVVATQSATKAQTTAVNAQSDATTAIQTASEASLTATDANSNAVLATQTATKAQTTATNLASNVTVATQTASEASVTATNASRDATTALTTASGASVTASKANSLATTASVTATGAQTTATNAQSDAVVAQTTATKAQTTATNASKDATTALTTASGASVTATNAKSDIAVVATTASDTSANLKTAQGDITSLKASASQASLDIADNKKNVASVTATAKGLQATVASNSSDISGLKTTTASQATQLSQTASQVALKADQAAVDTLKGTVTANSAAISVQADEIKQKVTSSDVQGLLNNGGYATQTWTSSQIDLTSNKFNLNLSALQTQVDNSAVGTNLLTGTADHIVTGLNTNGYLSNETTDDFLSLFQGLEGETVTISVDYEYQGFVKGSGRNRLGWEIGIIADSTSWVGAWHSPNNDSGSGRISSTFVVPKNVTGIREGMGFIQFSGSGTGTLSHLKLEKGSVATDWCPNPADNASVTSVTNLEATVDGLQTTVSNKVNTTDYNSKMTQLSNLIDSRVSTADYNAEVAILANDIDLKVAKGDVVSQINQEAGGNTLIQVASGKGKLFLDAATTVFGGTAFISDAMITSLNADKISGGMIDGKLISANALNVALDNWSSNLQLTPDSLQISDNGSPALVLNDLGINLFNPNDNTGVGNIAGALYTTIHPGLAFNLANTGDWMGWAAKDSSTQLDYSTKFSWFRDNLAGDLDVQPGLHAFDTITFHGNIYPRDATHADASHIHFQDITVNGVRGFGIVNDLGCGIVICDNRTVWAVKQTNGTATQILG